MKKAENLSEAIEQLTVIETLEIGPVRVDKKRLIAPYKIRTKNGSESAMNLEYSYETEVFDPTEPDSINLAHIIAAQVALNYGLFCEKIIFHGLFDRHDQRFIKDMALNTAREIYVKKILEPNSFLIGPVSQLPHEKLDRYLRSEIIFSDEPADFAQNKNDTSKASWHSDEKRHAVLSSGGKDSLLSYSLLQEIGKETHSVFINESGRHWYTALNAYRYFKNKYPETARVWTNADRIFSWMLRHFSFIRQDFARLRSDEYPIRLWTVAVFLFGALPILRKRGIGRLIIGDEFDTTRRLSYRGITHYDGLYDQSRYFDNALTQYFSNKKWGIRQFSLLRTLSELLIQKILVKRYPEHQSQQMSCHATHIEGNRVKPCGKCEKCRRIVGMLMALDADPKNCGYTETQIENCLREVAKQGVHQEAEGGKQLAFMLMEKELIPAVSKQEKNKLSHPEILKLRIDPERSPLKDIPADLQEPLLKIWFEYTEGALIKKNREWEKFEPIVDSKIKPKTSGEAESTNNTTASKSSSAAKSYILGEITWPEAKKRFKEVDVALLPVGAIEQHGLHLPLDTDAYDANFLSQKVAEMCSDPKPIVLPLIPYGVSYHHDDFKGTISITNETLSSLVYEIGMSLANHGIKKLVIINGHGGNSPALQFAAQKINRDAHIFTCVDSGETSDTDIERIAETENDVHAGEIETSTSLAIRPELVKLDKARKFIPRFSSRYLNFSSKRSVEWYARTEKISSTGVMGNPLKADKNKGEEIWHIMIKNLVEFVEQLKSMTLDEIYTKRY